MLLNNRYRILQSLGSGGFGDTFLASDTQMPSQRRCVIKLLKPIHNNPQIYRIVRERFGREAAILEKLGSTSSQIPTLYAYFHIDEQFYLVQELIEGITLTAKRQQDVLSESTVQEILVNILPVLEYIHTQGIVHRDIKPDNIILRRDGKPVLIDFGAVRETMATVVNSQGNTTSSIVIGTPGYMPGEQAAGRPIFASDLYSLGLSAIYLLTGKQPHQLETDTQTGEIIWHDDTNLLARIIDRAIAIHPRDRYSSAREMLYALQNIDSVPPTLLRAPATTAHQPTVASVPLTQNQKSVSHNHWGWQYAIIGSIVGALVVGVWILKPSSNQPQPQIISNQGSQSNQVSTPTPNVTQNQVDNYSWLSSRLVTDADLDSKDGLELDIMRNTIFAFHGRRFFNPGLQKYFDNQPWYRPKYSPSEFPTNLLSDLERQNVEYISEYQDRNNKRHFQK